MQLDVEAQLNAVQRSVASTERDGQPAQAICLQRSYAVPVKELWNVVTNGDCIAKWFIPVSGELALGGRFQLQGNASGTITHCDPHSHLGLTWEFGGDLSWVEVRLTDGGSGRAILALEHTSLNSEQWATYGPGATGVGWEMGLLGLDLYVAKNGDHGIDAATFHTTAVGKALLTGSSERWGAAAVTAGADPHAAHAAAQQTTAFYTGEPAP